MLWHSDAMFDRNIHSNHVIITSLDNYLPKPKAAGLSPVDSDEMSIFPNRLSSSEVKDCLAETTIISKFENNN